MGVGTGGGTGGTCPPINLPSEIFLTQYSLLLKKLAQKNVHFHENFPARFARQSRYYKSTNSNSNVLIITTHLSKSSCVSLNIQKVCNQLFNIQSPSLIFKIIGYNFNTIPVPKSQEKELSCRHSFFVPVGPENHNFAHNLPKFLWGRTTRPPPLLPYSTKA